MVEELLGAITALQANGGASAGSSEIVKESLDNVRAMLAREDRGWTMFKGAAGAADTGLTLEDLKKWSARLRESVASPRIKRGFSLRHSFVWKGGIQYSGVPTETRGRGPKVQEKINDALNQRTFFSKQARRRRELCLYADGIALWLGDDVTKRLYAVPLEQITGFLSDPDFPGVIWAYRRTWQHRKVNGEHETRTRWYFVDDFKDQEVATIQYGTSSTEPEEVDTTMTAFDMHANSFEGWALGMPDALAAWIWDQIAKGLFLDGVDVSEAMATLAFKVNAATQRGAQNAALQFASPQGAGGTAVMGAGTDLSVLSSAGKGYDFSSIREVVALVASSLDVSNIHLTSNPGDAGSSYGSAASLDEPGRLTMMTRRDEHVDLDERVLRWMGAEKPKAYFHPYDDGTEMYRRLQTVTLPWLQGVISDEKYKELAALVLGVPDLGSTPDGLLIPNNRDSLARRDIDKDGAPTGSAASPTQGRASGDGGGAPRDTRDDTLT